MAILLDPYLPKVQRAIEVAREMLTEEERAFVATNNYPERRFVDYYVLFHPLEEKIRLCLVHDTPVEGLAGQLVWTLRKHLERKRGREAWAAERSAEEKPAG